MIDKKFHNKDNRVQHELKMANFEAFLQAQNSFLRGVWALGLILSKTQSLTLNSLKLYFKEGGGDYGT